MANPPTLLINVTAPGTLGLPSYTDVKLNATSAQYGAIGTLYDAWCVDRSTLIDVPGNYTAYLYSSYELGLLALNLPNIGNQVSPYVASANLDKLDSVNWLANEWKVNHSALVSQGYTYGDVQQAIYTLLGDGLSTNPDLGPFDTARVTQLADAASTTGNGFVPRTDQYISVILDPVNSSGVHQQPLIIQTLAAQLGNFVWLDANANGAQDAGENGLNGVTVNLWRDLNSNNLFDGGLELLGSTLTGANPAGDDPATPTPETNGYYEFKGLTPGLSYQVQFVLPANYSFTGFNLVNDTLDSDAGAGGITPAVVLAPGEFNRTLDAGLVQAQPARLGDRLWTDANGNGVQDAGEAGIQGQTVTLIGGGLDGLINGIGDTSATATTGVDGIYGFENLTPGVQYQVLFDKPAGTVFTGRDLGGDDTEDSDADATTGRTPIVTLAPGENNPTLDAGVYAPAALGDRVWNDTNANGQQDNGESGVPGVTVELYKCIKVNGVDQPSGPVLATDVTDANGIYNFTGLPPGDYIVKFITPTGFTLTTANVGADGTDSDAGTGGLTGCYNLESGETDNTVDAGLVPLARIGDRVWEDKNGDGEQDAGENGIPGAIVKLYTCVNNAPGVFVGQTTTDANGNYTFANLQPGDYIVEFTTPGGYERTLANVGADGSDSDNVGGLSGCYNLSPGENEDTVDAGFYRPAALGDRVWSDANANGQQDTGENGVANVTVELYACVNNLPSGPVLATKVTDANGIYNFTGLAPGDYIVKFITPTGFTLTTANVGADATDSDAGIGGLTGCYNLESGETDNTVDAGLVPLARIGDRVWEDKDGDGQQDAGENGIPGATVKLYTCVNNAPGVFVGQAITDANGNYSFANLAPGDYIVEFTTPNGFERTQANVGADGSDSDNVGGLSGCYNLSPGENENTVDAGFYRPAALGDRVWLDANANGQQDAGEANVANVTVELYRCVNDQPSGPVLATDVTDANGIYNFTGLAPGDYIVKFITPAGFTLTTANVGADVSDSDAGTGGLTGCYNLESGETDNTVDAGLVPANPGIEIIKDAGQTLVAPNTPVTFTYSVKNTGGLALANIVVTDDNATPDNSADDFAPTAVLGANGKNVGDLDGDSLLDTTEIWKYSATVIPPVNMTVTVEAGATPIAAGQLIYTTLPTGDIRVTYLQNNNFNDNTYGTGSDAGWAAIGKTHKFGDLTGSDKAGFEVKSSDGTVLFKFYQDYITSSSTNLDGYGSYSGYQSLGYSGGDGSLVTGGTLNAQAGTLLKDFDSTLETNLNQPGSANNGTAYTAMTVNSPVGDANWNVVNGYSFVIDKAAFTSSGKTFGGVTIFDQHNSPAKTGGSNSYVPDIVGGASINTATVTGVGNGTTVTDDDDATVIINTGALGSLGDRVWFDADADGVQDGGEAGIAGVTMRLEGDFDQNGTVDYTAITVTGANGLYAFGGLPAGEYKVSVDNTTLPVSYVQTYDLDGLATPHSALGELTSGQNRTDFDFGYVASAPGFSLVKTADKAAVGYGQTVTYTYDVFNTGAVPLANVVVRDDNATPDYAGDDFAPSFVGGDDGDGLLETGEVWKYQATVIPPQNMTVTISGTSYDSGSLTYATLPNGDIRVTYLQDNNFNDNTYGTGSDAGWTSQGKTHKFGDLTGSDKAGFEVRATDGTVLFKFYQDYITSSATNLDGYGSYSGYQSLGFSGGDGSLVTGGTLNAQATTLLKDFDSTIETNLNQPGSANNGTAYTAMIVNSPVGDANWNVVNGYSFVIDKAAFTTSGKTFGGVTIFDQHNSPAKTGGSNSYVPDLVPGESTNTALATAQLNGQTVVAIDDATVAVGPTGGGGGGPAKFFVADVGSDKTYKYAATGTSVGDFALQAGNTDPRDIAANLDGTRLWVLDKDDDVNVYDGSTGAALGAWTATTMGAEPEGISVDGSDLWLAARDRKIYWYDEAASRTSGSDAAEKTFTPSMSGNLKGIVSDGTSLWAVTEGGTDYVYRFTIARDGSGNPTGLTQSGQWTLASANSKPTGITLDPTGASQSLWIVDESSDSVYEYGSGRSLSSGTGAVSNIFALADTNAAPQGIADPLAWSTDAFDTTALIDAAYGPGYDAACDVALIGLAQPLDHGLPLMQV
ncbi:MAG: carboxypeptidase regulatory-like domain-containing protein [Rubrivivax sp.]|nr:carboxypeptidase regulatory-like domain-containing protein [Rubrivivax sp.]